MIASDFSDFADALIQELGPHLRSVATDFHRENGRGAVQIELHDADQPNERTSKITYLPLDTWPVASHPRHLLQDYDPTHELVLHIVFDGMALTRRLRFSELARAPRAEQVST